MKTLTDFDIELVGEMIQISFTVNADGEFIRVPVVVGKLHSHTIESAGAITKIKLTIEEGDDEAK